VAFVLFVSNWRCAPGSGAGLLMDLGGLGVLVVNAELGHARPYPFIFG
jgi:hypothetical protein